MNDYPNTLDVLEIMGQRIIYPSSKLLSEISRLQKGREGENIVLDYLKKYGRPHWKIVQNLWLDYHGPFESDFTLFTRNGQYLIEVKHYTGIFKYDGGISSLNNREISGNSIYQTRRAVKNLRELTQQKIPRANVQGVLVFIGEDNPIDISPEIKDIHILERNEFKYFVQEISALEDTGGHPPIDFEKVMAHIKKREIANPYQADPISPEKMAVLRKGILCSQCGNERIELTRKYVKCVCGCVELRDEATVRTICEYGVLNYDKPLRRKELFDFLDGHVSPTYLKNILNKYFNMVNKGRYTYYENYRLPYHKIKHLFYYNS